MQSQSSSPALSGLLDYGHSRSLEIHLGLIAAQAFVQSGETWTAAQEHATTQTAKSSVAASRHHRIRLPGLAKTMFVLQQKAETDPSLTFKGTGIRFAFPSRPGQFAFQLTCRRISLGLGQGGGLYCWSGQRTHHCWRRWTLSEVAQFPEGPLDFAECWTEGASCASAQASKTSH